MATTTAVPSAGGITEFSGDMVKWIGSLNPESCVSVEATVKRPVVAVRSFCITNYELHLTKGVLRGGCTRVFGLDPISSEQGRFTGHHRQVPEISLALLCYDRPQESCHHECVQPHAWLRDPF